MKKVNGVIHLKTDVVNSVYYKNACSYIIMNGWKLWHANTKRKIVRSPNGNQ